MKIYQIPLSLFISTLFITMPFITSFGQQRTIPASTIRENVGRLQNFDSVAVAGEAVISRSAGELFQNPQALQQNINMLQTEVQQIRVTEADGSTRFINSNLRDFKLKENQNVAFIESDQMYIDDKALPLDAKVLKGVYVAKCATPGSYGDQVQFQLVLLKAYPVVFNAENQAWDGSVRMKCVQIGSHGDNPPAAISLQEPVMYNLTVNGKDFGDKEILEINKEVAEPYNLQVTEKVQDKVIVGLRQMGETESLDELAPVVPYIQITCDKDRMQGYGIQTANVTVSLVGSTSAGPIQVPLKSDKGHLEPDVVTISGSEPLQTAKFRSEGTGSTVLSANLTGILTTSQVVSFGFPWSFLISSLIGAAIGTLIRLLAVRKEGFNFKSFIAGVLIGFAVATCYWAIGLNLLSVTIDINYLNEFAVIALSLLGGYFGAFKIGGAVAGAAE